MYAPTHGANDLDARSVLRRIPQSPTGELLVPDLLTRELIQNSLDAWDGKSTNVSVAISFNTAEAVPKMGLQEFLGDHLLGKWLTERLGANYFILRIRDGGTFGLTGGLGPAGGQESGDRFRRVVFRYGIPDDAGGRGGSWGLGGKTMALGAAPSTGLVIYWSRPSDGGKPRLIGVHCHAHPAKSPTGNECPRGFAWWGKEAGDSVAGFEGEEAEAWAAKLGLHLDKDWRGTEILIPMRPDDAATFLAAHPRSDEDTIGELPGLNRPLANADAVAAATNTLTRCARRWYWPRILHVPREITQQLPIGGRTRLQVEVNGEKVELAASPLYSRFANLYLESFSPERSTELKGQRYGAYSLGRISRRSFHAREVAADLVKEWSREARWLGFDSIDDARPEWTVATIRGHGLVHAYRLRTGMRPAERSDGFLALPAGHPGVHLAVARVSGVQYVATNKESHDRHVGLMPLEEVVRLAEDPAHCQWAYEALTERSRGLHSEEGKGQDWLRAYLSQFSRSVEASLVEQDAARPVDEGPTPPMLALAQMLGKLSTTGAQGVPGPGGDSKKPPPKGGPGGSARRSGCELLSLEPTGQVLGAFRARLRARGRGVLGLDLVVHDGRSEIGRDEWETDEAYPITNIQLGPNPPASVQATGTWPPIRIALGSKATELEFEIMLRISGKWLVAAVGTEQAGGAA